MANGMTLAVKYRPKAFEDVCGQRYIIDILKRQIETNTFLNGYLFTGGAGTGKTTCARIFAALLNSGQEDTAIEIDAASNNGVENVRSVIDGAKYQSTISDYKVYIFDEVHMLSVGAFNALLKTLEEPPANTIFIMCTTDPQKIPNTILSRVQRFDFQRLSQQQIVERLIYIMQEEGGIVWNMEAVEYIAKVADGGMRDAITMLEKCLGYNGTNLILEDVVRVLGVADYNELHDLLVAILDGNAKTAISIIQGVHASGRDLKRYIKQLVTYIIDLKKREIFGDYQYTSIPPYLDTHIKTLLRRPEVQAEEALEYILDRFVKLQAEIKWEGNPKYLIEAEVIVLCR